MQLSASSKFTTISLKSSKVKFFVHSIGCSQHYLSQLPIAAIQYLDKSLDWDNEYDRDVNEIARHLLKWEEVLAEPFKLTRTDIHDISKNQKSLELQRLVPQ